MIIEHTTDEAKMAMYTALCEKRESYTARFWELKFDEPRKTDEEIAAVMTSEGCPTPDEVEAAFIAATGMSFETAGEMAEVRRQLQAEARYSERFCKD